MRKYYESSFEDIGQIVDSSKLVKNMEDCTHVMVGPGGMGAFYDIFRAKKLGKKLILFNKNGFYSGLCDNLHRSYLEGYIDDTQKDYMSVVNSEEELRKMVMEEDDYGKTNNGQTR